jgi:hypothetical protein
VGDGVAAVAAIDEDTAIEALDLPSGRLRGASRASTIPFAALADGSTP